MCDTLFAAAELSKDQRSLFAKNSDRPPNEAQHLAWFPSRKHSRENSSNAPISEFPRLRKLQLSYFLNHTGCGERK